MYYRSAVVTGTNAWVGPSDTNKWFIVTCEMMNMTNREYYREKFVNLDAAFKDRIIRIEELNEHLRDEEKEKLLKRLKKAIIALL